MTKKKAGYLKSLPQRTCVACLKTGAKRELIRIVRTPLGTIEIDPTGKKSGRGTYLCKTSDCWETALKKNRLEHALKLQLPPESRSQLLEYGMRLTSHPSNQASL